MVKSDKDKEYVWYTKQSKQFLEKDYLIPGQSLDDRVNIICNAVEKLYGAKIPQLGERLKHNIKKGWYSLSSPIWSNFGTDRGLPISCYGSYVSDNMESILYSNAEVGMMTKFGGGTSVYFGELRPRGSEIRDNGVSSGAVHFMQIFDSQMQVISQGSVRRGSMASYLPVSHPDILEFLKIKSEGFYIQNLSFGVTVTDSWLNEMISGDAKKRKIWAKILESRINVGYPYIFFTDTANNNTVDVYKDKKLTIHHTNLCTEIFLPDSSEESFVCDLASMNLLHYDEWKDTDAVELLVYLLDAVMEEFIHKTNSIKFMERANLFAKRHRALGIGVLGWHSLLQSKMIAFESFDAKMLNVEVFKNIKEKAYIASEKLANLFGEPELLRGYGRRNTTLLAVAPTKSSAWILGQVSEGIEPNKANYYIKDLAKGKFSVRNPFLENLLESKEKNTEEVWNKILMDKGSVRNLEFLTKDERDIFKTFEEISPKEIIIQASQRQKYIDQGQSLNLMIHPKTPVKDLNALILEAWKLGIKSLYYQISVNAAQELSMTNILDCKSCES